MGKKSKKLPIQLKEGTADGHLGGTTSATESTGAQMTSSVGYAKAYGAPPSSPRQGHNGKKK